LQTRGTTQLPRAITLDTQLVTGSEVISLSLPRPGSQHPGALCTRRSRNYPSSSAP